MRMHLALLAIAIALAGCSAIEVKPDAIPVNPMISELCDLVPDPPPRGAAMGDLYTFSHEMIGLYGECALRDKAKADWIKSQGH